MCDSASVFVRQNARVCAAGYFVASNRINELETCERTVYPCDAEETGVGFVQLAALDTDTHKNKALGSYHRKEFVLGPRRQTL